MPSSPASLLSRESPRAARRREALASLGNFALREVAFDHLLHLGAFAGGVREDTDFAVQANAGVFDAYRADPSLMQGDWPHRLPPDEPWRSRHVADFIAGMTDRYAIARYREIVGRIDLPEGF